MPAFSDPFVSREDGETADAFCDRVTVSTWTYEDGAQSWVCFQLECQPKDSLHLLGNVLDWIPNQKLCRHISITQARPGTSWVKINRTQPSEKVSLCV